MTPLRLAAVLLLLTVGGGCGRVGSPVRAARAPAAGAAVQAAEPAADEAKERKEEEEAK